MDGSGKKGFHTHLGVPVYAVGGPTARLHLVRVQAPELKFLFKQRPTNVSRIVQFSSAALEKENVEYLQHLLKQCPRHSRLINTVSFSVALPVVVQYLSKHAGVSVKEVLVQDGIVVGQRLRQP